MKCGNCGNENPPNVDKCIYCGAELNNNSQDSDVSEYDVAFEGTVENNDRRRRNNILKVSIVSFIAVLIIFLGIYGYRTVSDSSISHFGGGGGGGGGGPVVQIPTVEPDDYEDIPEQPVEDNTDAPELPVEDGNDESEQPVADQKTEDEDVGVDEGFTEYEKCTVIIDGSIHIDHEDAPVYVDKDGVCYVSADIILTHSEVGYDSGVSEMGENNNIVYNRSYNSGLSYENVMKKILIKQNSTIAYMNDGKDSSSMRLSSKSFTVKDAEGRKEYKHGHNYIAARDIVRLIYGEDRDIEIEFPNEAELKGLIPHQEKSLTLNLEGYEPIILDHSDAHIYKDADNAIYSSLDVILVSWEYEVYSADDEHIIYKPETEDESGLSPISVELDMKSERILLEYENDLLSIALNGDIITVEDEEDRYLYRNGHHYLHRTDVIVLVKAMLQKAEEIIAAEKEAQEDSLPDGIVDSFETYYYIITRL